MELGILLRYDVVTLRNCDIMTYLSQVASNLAALSVRSVSETCGDFWTLCLCSIDCVVQNGHLYSPSM